MDSKPRAARGGRAGSGAASAGLDAGLTHLADASGRVAAPAAWAKEFRDAGWEPAVLRLPPGERPAVLVGPDLSTWDDPASRTPGMFAGLLPVTGTAPALPDHRGCVRQPERRSGEARIFRWTRCAGGDVSYSEVLLPGVYVQIKQIGTVDRTDRLLSRLRIR